MDDVTIKIMFKFLCFQFELLDCHLEFTFAYYLFIFKAIVKNKTKHGFMHVKQIFRVTHTHTQKKCSVVQISILNLSK